MMTTTAHDWLTLHRLRFRTARDGNGAPLAPPARALAWRVYPSSPIGENGMRTNVSDVWGGLAIYDNRADAEADLAEMDATPWADDVAERWSALAIPFRHHGGVKWREKVREGTTIRVAPSDPGGRLAVLTSAGYANPGPAELPRVKNFMANVDRVVDAYRALEDNIVASSFSGAAVDGHDGATITLWRDDAAMHAAAYKAGVHKTQMDAHAAAPMFDRSSWTRTRIVASAGTWDGLDPAI
jgi:hypothetical protein